MCETEALLGRQPGGFMAELSGDQDVRVVESGCLLKRSQPFSEHLVLLTVDFAVGEEGGVVDGTVGLYYKI